MTAQAVADLVGGRLSGRGETRLTEVRSLDLAGEQSLAVCSANRYAAALAASRAGAVLLPEALAALPGPATRIIVAEPSRAMYLASRALHPQPAHRPGIAPDATIGRGARFGIEASIGHGVVIGAEVTIGDRATIGPHVVIEDGVTIGDDVRLDPRVTLYAGAVLGSRVHCKAGAVIAGPGFGYISDQDGHHRIPHVGRCILEDDVEVGSNSCIDRGSLDDTVIGRGTKIDNEVHIGHNVHTGERCLIMACVGIAGSTRIGDRVILAGQAGVIDHIEIGDDVKAGARTAIMSNLPAGAVVSGYPARPHRDYLRAVATMYQLAGHGDALETLAREREDV
ncbi:MAG: UDP-3-O-(3-hydroxymyristoyl)glucosamine N-acyltransferase [Gemmatimonadales bacterium]